MTLFQRLGQRCARQRWWVVAVWSVLALAALPLAPQAPGALSPGGFSLDDLEAARTRQTLESEIGLPPSALVIVVRSETDVRAGDPAFELAVATALAGVASAEHVTGVLPHTLAPNQVSEDGRTVYHLVSLDLPPDASPDAIVPVEEALRDVPGYTTYLAGGPAFYGDIQIVSERDLQRSELIGLPLAAVALLVVFGSVVAAGVPIVVGGIAVLIALAVIFLVASVTPMSIFVLNLATLLGFGLGVDYALLLSSRFREELARGNGGRRPDGTTDQAAVEAAVVATVGTAGRAAFFSGITVLLGLIGLILFDFMVLRSVGVAGAVVVAFAVVAAVTLLPAVLAIIGPRIDSLRLPRLRRAPPGTEGQRGGSVDLTGMPEPGGWARLARWVMDRPVRVFLPTLGLLIVLGLPFLHVRFNAPDATILPPDVPSRQAYDLLVSEFQEGEFAPLLLAVRTDGPATTPENVGALFDYSRRIAADQRVARVESIVDIDPRLQREQYQLILSDAGGPADRYVADRLTRTTREDLTTFSVITWYGPNRTEARALVDDLRDPASALAPPPGIEVLVGGGAAEVKDVVDRIGADFPRSALFILISTYLVLFLLLRSVILPLKALIINALSILASFGALVWIFQDGNLSALLGFQPLGFVETTLPVILFCVLFGLSMDYEVFLLSRMKESYDRTGDNREAVAQGLERSGRIVTSAALIVVVVAGSFAFAEVVLIKAVGLGVAIAVALDATVVRALLVPSTMRLLGDRNWWMPARLRRWIGTRLPVIEGAAFQAIVLSVVAALLLAACSPSGRLLANEPVAPPPVPVPTPAASRAPDPRPVVLPRDNGSHDRLTEWWYYTGHLTAEDGRSFGFEYVIFRAERGAFPVAWASHLAVTDEDGDRFLYDQRSEIGPQVDRSRSGGSGQGIDPPVLDLAVRGEVAPGIPAADAVPWTITGGDGHDRLSARGTANGDAFGLDLDLDDGGRPVALHDHDGYIDFGPAGGSYYYSRTKLDAAGSLTLDGQELAVEGTAWFDHQWGDFIAVGAGGWDWFAVNLDDGTDFTLSLVRDAEGGYPLVYGTLVRADGEVEHLPREAFDVTVTEHWTSELTGATYPAGWRIELPDEGLVVDLLPTVAAQELDTRPTTGVVYWEGSQVVTATRDGVPLGGEAYVELTGYGPGPSSQAP
ncbi:MAG: MMPL family transporter [Chloroflexi bacterium]|nr:MMPL family transporter [Chloroflexota bacterium]